jgi:hypothetical protein
VSLGNHNGLRRLCIWEIDVEFTNRMQILAFASVHHPSETIHNQSAEGIIAIVENPDPQEISYTQQHQEETVGDIINHGLALVKKKETN